MGLVFRGYHATPHFYGLPKLIEARMKLWQNEKPKLEAFQEAADYFWELYDKDLISIPLPPALAEHLNRLKAVKAKLKPVGWEKVDEEWEELMNEVGHPKEAKKLKVDEANDTPLNRPMYEQLLAALGFPLIPIEKFLQYSAWKLDGRLQYEQLNASKTNVERKADLKEYESIAAKKALDLIA